MIHKRFLNQNLLELKLHILNSEIFAEIHKIQNSIQARSYMTSALERMKEYQPTITAELNKYKMPHDLLALPLIESGYKPLGESQNRVKAAGIGSLSQVLQKNMA